MAVLSNGLVLLMVLVAATFVSRTEAAQKCDCVTYPDLDCCWLEFFTAQAERQEAVSSASILDDTDVSTTAFPEKGRTLYVGKGKGAYRTIQAAINAVPDNNIKRVTIYIPNGVYRQKLLIKSAKAFIYFKCQSKKTVITWGDTAAKAGGTAMSASIAIEADGFIASDCTFANSAPEPVGGAVGQQAVALRIQGDKGAFYRCGFYGAQDTLYDKAGRHFFRSCDIHGSIDWIFGDGQSFYQYCRLISIAQGSNGAVTAQKRDSNSKSGFVFYQCSVSGRGSIYLGRAWGTHSRVIFYQCNIASLIRAEGYYDWADPKRDVTIFYAEYKCYGPGANRNGRVKWSKELTDQQAKPFGSIAFIDGKSWLEPRL